MAMPQTPSNCHPNNHRTYLEPPDTPANRRSGRTNHHPGQYTERQPGYAVLAADQVRIPKNHKEALSSEYSVEWSAAMTADLAALSEMKTWTLSELPPGSKPIRTKWVFDLKLLVSGEIDRFKARLVAKGYAQRLGMDYNEVFAPVAKHANIRFILSMAADPAACLAQLDVSTDILGKYKMTIMGLYKTRDLGEPSVFVGYEITRDRSKGTLHTCQSRFIQELLKAYNIMAASGSDRFPIPLKPEASLPYPETGQPETGLPLAQIVGPLNYLAINTRPDIAQAVNRKSITGWVFSNQGGAISWQSKIQASTTELSRTEAEYVAATSAAQEAMWLRKLQHCATGVQPPGITICGDNQAALSAWNQEKLSSRMRHMETRYHFLMEQAKVVGIKLQWVPTAANMADMFTKALPKMKSSLFRDMIGCRAKTST
eukprot:gene23251-biopygen31824